MENKIFKPTVEEIKEILSNHKLWLSNNDNGKRANLQGANLQGANLQDADLQGAYLQGADLQGAYLQDADLQGADLQGAYLQRAYLQGADLQGAYLQGAYLRGAYLQDADLQGADLQRAKRIIRIESQYPYQSYGYYCDGKKRVRLGCYDRTIEEWDADFWNNESDFPKDSPQGKNRFMIYTFLKTWLIENEQ